MMLVPVAMQMHPLEHFRWEYFNVPGVYRSMNDILHRICESSMRGCVYVCEGLSIPLCNVPICSPFDVYLSSAHCLWLFALLLCILETAFASKLLLDACQQTLRNKSET